MKADPIPKDQARAPGLYDEQLQRVQQEKMLARKKRGAARPAFFTQFARDAD